MNSPSVIWLVLIVILFAVEAYTLNLTTIWFAIGSVVGFILSTTGFSITTQIVWSLLVSIVMFIFTKPIVDKKLKPGIEPTNSNALIGKRAIVTDEISSEKFAGKVKIGGQEWSAISSDDTVVLEGENVIVKSIDGVKLVVEKEN